MSFSEEQGKYILSLYPDSSNDNTEFYLRVLETACKQHNIELNEGVKRMIRQYKPEAVVRRRRQLVDSTQKQREKEEEMRQEFSVKYT